ncbi:MAG: hypothetical protein J6L58_01630 [Clostridia bacterium]|nr:hypothetical protein [Clostridia bacterium]
MKKILALVLAIAMLATFAACGGAKEAEYKLGMGISVSLDSSKDQTAQADATVATVVLDAEGKIVAADLDCAQTKVKAADVDDLSKVDVRTKKEKKEDYNMKGASPIGKEWYEQAAAFVEKMVGKTVADIEAIETKGENGHNVAVDADLYAACTMDITAFKAAFVAACKDAQAKTFTAAADSFKLGLDVETNVTGSKATEAQLYSTFGAIVVDKDGKTLAAIVDEIQPKVTFDEEGVVADKKYTDTKRNLKEDYNMVKFSPEGTCIAEWYVQAASLTDYIAEKGMTADEIAAIATADTRKDGYMRPTDADLAAVCTMQIAGYQAVLANAAK